MLSVIDQIGASMKANGLGVELGNAIVGEHLANHKKAIRTVPRCFCCVDRAGGGVGGHEILRSLLTGRHRAHLHVATLLFDGVQGAGALRLVQNRTPALTPTVRGAPISPMNPDGAKLG